MKGFKSFCMLYKEDDKFKDVIGDMLRDPNWNWRLGQANMAAYLESMDASASCIEAFEALCAKWARQKSIQVI